MLIYSFITDYQAFNLRYKDNTTRDKNETKVDKQSANLGKNNEPIQNRLSFLIDCKSVILHHLAILSFPMVRPAWDNWRIVFFLIISVFYVAFWLNLAILFSLCFRQAATSALASVAVWLFFSVFYTMIVNLVAKALSPSQLASPYQIVSYQKFILGLMRLAPSELFNEATTTLLMPSVRSLGPLTMEQVQGAIPSPLPLGQSLLVVWPQLTGLIAATVICFALSYVIFMRREVRSR